MSRQKDRAEPGPADARLVVALDRRVIEVHHEDGGVDRWRIDRQRRASQAYGRRWSIAFCDMARLVAAARITPAASACLWWALGSLEARAFVRVRQLQVAAELGLHPSAVSRGFRDLNQIGLIQREGDAMRLSLALGWQGTAVAYQRERRKRAGEIEAVRAALDARRVACE